MYSNYYLDLIKVTTFDEKTREIIYDYYREMFMCDAAMAKSYFNTLNNIEVLKDDRDEKLTKILS